MIKALLVITGITGMSPYTVNMDNMEQCKQRQVLVMEQAQYVGSGPAKHNINAFCLPRNEKPSVPDKFESLMEIFMNSVDKLREENHCFNHPLDEDCEVDVLRRF